MMAADDEIVVCGGGGGGGGVCLGGCAGGRFHWHLNCFDCLVHRTCNTLDT